MSLTENGLGVQDGIRGLTVEHLPPAPGTDRAAGIPDVHEDGFCARNSGRPDLYPHAPMHFRSGPQQPVEAPPATQLRAPRPAQAVPDAVPAVTQ